MRGRGRGARRPDEVAQAVGDDLARADPPDRLQDVRVQPDHRDRPGTERRGREPALTRVLGRVANEVPGEDGPAKNDDGPIPRTRRTRSAARGASRPAGAARQRGSRPPRRAPPRTAPPAPCPAAPSSRRRRRGCSRGSGRRAPRRARPRAARRPSVPRAAMTSATPSPMLMCPRRREPRCARAPTPAATARRQRRRRRAHHQPTRPGRPRRRARRPAWPPRPPPRAAWRPRGPTARRTRRATCRPRPAAAPGVRGRSVRYGP